jgi:hypothetical protein
MAQLTLMAVKRLTSPPCRCAPRIGRKALPGMRCTPGEVPARSSACAVGSSRQQQRASARMTAAPRPIRARPVRPPPCLRWSARYREAASGAVCAGSNPTGALGPDLEKAVRACAEAAAGAMAVPPLSVIGSRYPPTSAREAPPDTRGLPPSAVSRRKRRKPSQRRRGFRVGRLGQRSGPNAARISSANSSGSSQAAKWPPLLASW